MQPFSDREQPWAGGQRASCAVLCDVVRSHKKSKLLALRMGQGALCCGLLARPMTAAADVTLTALPPVSLLCYVTCRRTRQQGSSLERSLVSFPSIFACSSLHSHSSCEVLGCGLCCAHDCFCPPVACAAVADVLFSVATRRWQGKHLW
jgi:hypothetical protein